MRQSIRLVVIVLFSPFLIHCHAQALNNQGKQSAAVMDKSLQIYKVVNKTHTYQVAGNRYTTLTSAQAQGFKEQGVASYYGKNVNGRKTASGQIIYQNELVAAHKTLPFNSYVLVTNLTNNQQVVVRIIDRGPFGKGKIIDLSHRAAKDLNMLSSGLAPVKIEVLNVDQKSNPTSKAPKK